MAKKVTPMRTIWKARELILHGKSVQEVSQLLNISKSIVYSYTKAERQKVRS